MSNKARTPSDGGGNQKKSPISNSSASTYDVGDTTVVISMTPTFIGSRTPTNFTSISRRASLSSQISKCSTSTATTSMFKSTRSKFTSAVGENVAPGASNIVNLGKQALPNLKTKVKNIKSISVESPRLLPYCRDQNLPLRSSHISIERGVYDNPLKPKDLPIASRSTPKISLRSTSSVTGRINKAETPRWIQGVLVKDIGKYLPHL